jgi:hypothetical protein
MLCWLHVLRRYLIFYYLCGTRECLQAFLPIFFLLCRELGSELLMYSYFQCTAFYEKTCISYNVPHLLTKGTHYHTFPFKPSVLEQYLRCSCLQYSSIWRMSLKTSKCSGGYLGGPVCAPFSPCMIYGELTGTGTGISLNYSVYPVNIIQSDLHTPISPGGWTLGPLVADVRRRSLTPSTWKTTTNVCATDPHINKFL